MSTRAHVDHALELLDRGGVHAWLAGGWAEEARGLRPEGPHADVDLVLPAPSFARLDALDVAWIPAKRFPWKRAFELDGVIVEVVLATRERERCCSTIRGVRFEWPRGTFSELTPARTLSAAALRAYRSSYPSFAPG